MSVPPEEVRWEEQIRGCEQAWMEAVRTHDLNTLEELLADEFEMVSASIGFADRAEFMRVVHDYALDSFEFVDSNVHVYGDWAIVHSRYRQQGTLRGHDVSHDFFLTDVWIFRDGRWQVMTRHSSTPTQGAWDSVRF